MKIRDLLNCDFYEDGVISGSNTLFGEMDASNWIVIHTSDHICWKRTVFKWGQIDCIHWKWCQNNQLLNFIIGPHCFHHPIHADTSFWWYGLISHQMNCKGIFRRQQNCMLVLSDDVFSFILKWLKLVNMLF